MPKFLDAPRWYDSKGVLNQAVGVSGTATPGNQQIPVYKYSAGRYIGVTFNVNEDDAYFDTGAVHLFTPNKTGNKGEVMVSNGGGKAIPTWNPLFTRQVVTMGNQLAATDLFVESEIMNPPFVMFMAFCSVDGGARFEFGSMEMTGGFLLFVGSGQSWDCYSITKGASKCQINLSGPLSNFGVRAEGGNVSLSIFTGANRGPA